MEAVETLMATEDAVEEEVVEEPDVVAGAILSVRFLHFICLFVSTCVTVASGGRGDGRGGRGGDRGGRGRGGAK